MNQVPTIISSKDLDYIKDMLNWNFIIIKKANHYLGHIQDKEVSSLINKAYDMHKQHYDQLLNMLNLGGNNE